MIIRIEKHERYVIIDSHMLENPELSWKAKGLLAYLLSKPNDWKVMMGDLVNHGTGGIESVRSAMTELRKHGYAELRPVQGEDGKMSGKEWVMIERPTDVAVLPTSGKTESRENRLSGKPPLLKNEGKPKTDKQTKNDDDPFGDADGNPPQPPFDTFYRLYPRKIGKAAALKSWNRQKLDAKADMILLSLAAQMKAGMFNLAEPSYIPHPVTWLNQGRWEDAISTHERTNGTKKTAPQNPRAATHMREGIYKGVEDS